MYVLFVKAISFLYLVLSISVVFGFLFCLGCEGKLNIGDPDGPDWRTLILFDGAAAAGERGRGRWGCDGLGVARCFGHAASPAEGANAPSANARRRVAHFSDEVSECSRIWLSISQWWMCSLSYSEPWGSASAGNGQDHDVPGFLLFPLKKHRSRWLIYERWSYYESSLLRMRLSKIFTPLNMIRKIENIVFWASPKWGYLQGSHLFYLEVFIHRNQIFKITRDTR